MTRGYTIVELLIVVVVIAILAAITVVSYNGITKNAKDAATDSALRSIKSGMEMYMSESGSYPPVCGADNSGCAISGLSAHLSPEYLSTMPSDGAILQYVRGTGAQSYAIHVRYTGKPACKTGVNVHPRGRGVVLPVC